MDQGDIYATRRQNLRALLQERYGGVQARLAEAIKRPSNYVWRLLSDGPHAKHVGDGLARVIEEQVGLPTRWLDKPVAVVQHVPRTISPVNVSTVAARLEPREVQIISWEALEAHSGPVTAILSKEEAAVGYVFSDGELGPHTFALTVRGDDMFPSFQEGERVIFDPDIEPIAGDIVLARVGPSLLFRRFRPRGSAHGDTFELVAMNQDFAPIWSDRAQVALLAVMVEHHRYRGVRGTPH